VGQAAGLTEHRGATRVEPPAGAAGHAGRDSDGVRAHARDRERKRGGIPGRERVRSAASGGGIYAAAGGSVTLTGTRVANNKKDNIVGTMTYT
jgi:hypothetical protein